jgi:ribose-phosphate pyrophosphokinase
MALIFPMPGNELLASELAGVTGLATGAIECRHFPDSESYVRVHGDVRNEDAVLVCTLAGPDEQFLPLTFAARALRSAGANRITLVAPYLAYLRQDRQFNDGEAVSSRIFADLIGREVDRLITVDPHLHRYASLGEIYRIPAVALHAGGLIGAWVRDHVESPVLLGPDRESVQWVEEIARTADCPWAVFGKERQGDRDVRLMPPPLDRFAGRVPVLADDIISSGATMLDAATLVREAGFAAPYCVAVHGLFDGGTAAKLEGVARSLITSDTIPNPYSHFKVAPLIAEEFASVPA